MGEAARLGVDVALITVQVEIVSAIDCASKCYTSHLSNLLFSSFFFLTKSMLFATVNVNSQRFLSLATRCVINSKATYQSFKKNVLFTFFLNLINF